jgi:hypothetical protein
MVVIRKLKCCWLLFLFIGVVLAILGATKWRGCLLGEVSIYGGGAIVGFASSAFFSRQDQFLIRGVGDRVCLVQNRLPLPQIYELADPETLNAFGGIWHEISHVSDGMKRHLVRLLGKGVLSVKNASLCQVRGEDTVFAVLCGTRYAVHDMETLKRIWGNSPKINNVGVSEVDKCRPGKDLVSVENWPKGIRG